MSTIDRYSVIISAICEAKGIARGELFKILQNRDCRYLLFLLLKKYNCINTERLSNHFEIKNEDIMNSEVNKAKERFMINSYFRNTYFEVDDIVKKTINTKNHIL